MTGSCPAALAILLIRNFVSLSSSVKKNLGKCTYECACEDTYELTVGPPKILKFISNCARRYYCDR